MQSLKALTVAVALPFALGACGMMDGMGGDRAQTAAAPTQDIVETADAAGDFETLLTAAEAAGLVDTLKGPGPLTVFAPTDEAFARLPPGTLDALLLPENRDALAAVLSYHVVPGRVTSADLAGTQMAVRTVEGNSLNVDALDPGEAVQVNDADVVAADVMAENGVIHVIDEVLLPPQLALQ